MYPFIERPGPRCADCGAHVDDVDLVWNGDMRNGYWLCADDVAGCTERTLRRYGGDTLLERALRAHDPIWPDDEAAHVAETVDELLRGDCQDCGVHVEQVAICVCGMRLCEACYDWHWQESEREIDFTARRQHRKPAAHVAETVDELREEACSHQWVMIRPSRPGPDGWAKRCKLCGAYVDISAEARADTEAEYRRHFGDD